MMSILFGAEENSSMLTPIGMSLQVRVPLNTARKLPTMSPLWELKCRRSVIAVQNMEASGIVAKEQEVEFRALEGSLSMMSKGSLSGLL